MHQAGPGSDVAEDVHAWAQQALALLMSLDGIRRVGLAVVEGGGRRLHFTSAEIETEPSRTWCHVDAFDDVPLNAAIRTGRPVLGTLAALHPSYPAFIDRQHGTGTVALAAVPLVVGGDTLGGFVLFYDAAPAWDEEGHDRLTTLGTRLGSGLRDAQQRQSSAPDAWAPTAAPAAVVAQFEVRSDLSDVAAARRHVRSILLEWDIDTETTEIATLCMSELVTNAVIHAGSGCAVHVSHDAGVVSVAVRNAGPALTPAAAAVPDDPLRVHGRGLQIVDGLASRWGAESDSVGMTVWFALDT
ncbi:MAG TPA: ATP-binding protein [Nocardioides sp.]|nr:ATP-binding protein [Nocardioides sp.]